MFHRDSEVKVLKSVQLVLMVSYLVYQTKHAFVVSFKPGVVSFTIQGGRYFRVLTMVYNTQRYWVFGLRPSSGLLFRKNPDDGQSPKTQYLRVEYKVGFFFPTFLT
jgi:hypothetical protein